MESLPADLQRKIALELSPSELIKLCSTNKSLYKNVCDDKAFWRFKYQKDYPGLFRYFSETGLPLRNPKHAYIREFTLFSTFLEKELEEVGLSRDLKMEIFKELEHLFQRKDLEPEKEYILKDYIKNWEALSPEQKSGLLELKARMFSKIEKRSK